MKLSKKEAKRFNEKFSVLMVGKVGKEFFSHARPNPTPEELKHYLAQELKRKEKEIHKTSWKQGYTKGRKEFLGKMVVILKGARVIFKGEDHIFVLDALDKELERIKNETT